MLLFIRLQTLLNMTMEDYSKARRKDGFFTIIHIEKHKTSIMKSEHITLGQNATEHLRIYVEKVRPMYAKQDSNRVFTSILGGELTPRDISKIRDITLLDYTLSLF